MGKRVEIEDDYKIWLVEECLAKRMRGREAARRAGVGSSTMQKWISLYKREGAEGLLLNGNKKKQVYSDEVKRKVVEDYLSGKGSYRAISEKYKLRSETLVQHWVKEYTCHRILDRKEEQRPMAKKKYTVEEKLQAVKEHLDAGVEISTIAASRGISEQAVRNWIEKYQTMGVSGLEDRRGQRLAKQTPRTAEEELRIKYAQLERENYLLRMENALLKKVKELERGQD